jgi:glycosyltransferase involved in cell wall biosynthesis
MPGARLMDVLDIILQSRGLHVGAEIGVAFGGHSESILKFPAVTKLYGIDPYQHDPNYIDSMNLPQEEFDELYQFTTTRLSKFGDRYQHIRKPSQDGINEIPGQLDFVYIDADHSYKGVFKDISIWFDKVRDGGVIGGHDYDHPDLIEVKQAVDDFFSRLDWEVHAEGGTVWWVEKKKIQVSFIIPAFNCAKTLEESVNSIYDGNLNEGDEIVIVNDASTDNTQEILHSLSKKHPEIKVFEHKFNKGGGAARNTAIENTTFPLIFCLDSDNVLETGIIKKLRSFFVTSGTDIGTFAEVRYFNTEDHNLIHHKWIYKQGEITLSDYLAGSISPGSSGNYMFTKQSWIQAGRYPEFCFMDTWGFGLRQIASESRMTVMPDSYYFHRIGHESYWVRGSKEQNTSLIVLQLLVPILSRIEEDDVDFIMSRKGRYTWFDHLSSHPLRIKNTDVGINGYEEYNVKVPSLIERNSLIVLIKRVFRR